MLVVFIILTLAVLWADIILSVDGIHSVVTVLLMVVLYNLLKVKQMLREQKEQSEKKEPSEKKLPEPKLPWVCVSCGTENLGTVAYCTNCQTSREWSKKKEQEKMYKE